MKKKNYSIKINEKEFIKVFSNERKFYHLNNQDTLHRENDLPAVERPNGTKEWWLNGDLHREKGPAIEFFNGKKEWWWYGEKLEVNSQEEFEEKLSYLIMKDLHEE